MTNTVQKIALLFVLLGVCAGCPETRPDPGYGTTLDGSMDSAAPPDGSGGKDGATGEDGSSPHDASLDADTAVPGDSGAAPDAHVETDGGACGGSCTGSEPYCDVSSGECAQCREHGHCDDPAASQCAEGTCVPCAEKAHCEGITENGRELGVCAEQTCVECTGTDYGACGEDEQGKRYVCNSLEKRCSEQREASKGLCDACESDAACGTGKRCVKQVFKGQEVGFFCVWEQGAPGAPADCSAARPFVRTSTQASSIDGHVADYCTLGTTTCPALQQFRTAQGACGSGSSEDHSCGAPELQDGLCRAFSAAANRCTVPCLSSDDCELGVACNTSATPKYCDLQTGSCYGNADCPAETPTCNLNDHVCE